MEQGTARSRLSMLGAIFAFLTAVVVTVFGVVPSTAAPTRQPAGSGDTAAAEAGDTDAGASVSIAAPDETDEDLQVPGPLAAPAADLPEAPAHPVTSPAALAGHTGTNSPQATRGRAPPR
jgi:hypothetical protein